jgi:sodium transport system permease protein
MINQIYVIFLKEFKSILRDRKTFITGILIPFLLVPSIIWISNFSLTKTQNQLLQNTVANFESQDEINNTLNDNINYISLSVLAPMMLILYSCMGSAGYASDMTAGEKEHGTLESLLSTGANRKMIVLGKLATASVMGVLSSVCACAGFFVYLLPSGYLFFNLEIIFVLVIAMILNSIFFAALNLSIGIYSKSYKEAQTYMMPVSLICLIPSCFTYFLNINEIPFFYFSIPILNIICLMKEFLFGIINIYHILTVFFWLLVYTYFSVTLILRIFNKEKVIFRI